MSRRRGTPAWIYVAGAAGALAAGAALAARLGLRQAQPLRDVAGALPDRARSALPARFGGDGDGSAGAGAGGGAPEQPPGESWHCECGQELLVAGRDRHRVYWLPDAGPGDPILSGHCPNCDRPLPSESGIATD
jgi:hypothetical protein